MFNINFWSLKNSEYMSNWKTPAPNEVLKKFPSLYLPLSHHSLLWRKSIKKSKDGTAADRRRLPWKLFRSLICDDGGKEKETQKLFERIEGQLWIFFQIFSFYQSMCIKMPCKLLNICTMAGDKSKRDGIVCLLGASRLLCVLLSFVIMRSSSPLVDITVILHAARKWSGEVFFISVILSLFDENDNNSTQSTATATRQEENKKGVVNSEYE